MDSFKREGKQGRVRVPNTSCIFKFGPDTCFVKAVALRKQVLAKSFGTGNLSCIALLATKVCICHAKVLEISTLRYLYELTAFKAAFLSKHG